MSLLGKWDVHFLGISVAYLPQHGPMHLVGCSCEGCLVVITDHGPQAEVARALDMNFLWNAEEGVWKVWKKSNGTRRGTRRRVKRTTTTQRTDDHACME